jgi:hypothetical protein
MTHEELKELNSKMGYRARIDATRNVSELFGKTLTAIYGAEEGNDEIYFACSDGSAYLMYHEQDCCEIVSIEDICGDVQRLIGNPLTKAEEITNAPDLGNLDTWDDSYTWTWYQFATVKGYVTIRWYGESNGYYSESVDFIELCPPTEVKELTFEPKTTDKDSSYELQKQVYESLLAPIKGEYSIPFDETKVKTM